MATINVEGIPDGLLARLRLAAAGSGRSLNKEVVTQLARSVGCAREGGVSGGSGRGVPCAAGGCRHVSRQVEAQTVGWGGPA